MEPHPGTDPNLVGRKVFFVSPPPRAANELVGELVRHEFDVTVLADHTKIRDLFKVHSGSLVFINLDDGYSEPEWEEVVRESNTMPESDRPRIGIFSSGADPELSHKYLLDLEVACGFFKVDGNLEDLAKTMIKILEVNTAKGRRQFLRVPCREGAATLNFLEGTVPRTGNVADISSVGLACTFDGDPGIVARTMVTGIQLKLKGVLCQVSAVVMGTRPQEDGPPLYVFLFDPKTPEETREKIRGFLRKTLQSNLEQDLTSLQA